jgi:hypothetical protein
MTELVIFILLQEALVFRIYHLLFRVSTILQFKAYPSNAVWMTAWAKRPKDCAKIMGPADYKTNEALAKVKFCCK